MGEGTGRREKVKEGRGRRGKKGGGGGEVQPKGEVRRVFC